MHRVRRRLHQLVDLDLLVAAFGAGRTERAKADAREVFGGGP